MSESGDELYAVIERIYERMRNYKNVSPIVMAKEAMQAINFGRELHNLGYIAADQHFRQIARSFCRKRFDPVALALENDLFPETLQERYPMRGHVGEERVYVLLDEADDPTLIYNENRMERAAKALQKHADALRAYRIKRQNERVRAAKAAADADALEAEGVR